MAKSFYTTIPHNLNLVMPRVQLGELRPFKSGSFIYCDAQNETQASDCLSKLLGYEVEAKHAYWANAFV